MNTVKIAFVEDEHSKRIVAADAFAAPEPDGRSYSLTLLDFDELDDVVWSDFDVVLLDLGLRNAPNLTAAKAGFDVARMIREACPNLPMALVTYNTATSDTKAKMRRLSIKAGHFGGLPPDPEAWRNLVRQALEDRAEMSSNESHPVRTDRADSVPAASEGRDDVPCGPSGEASVEDLEPRSRYSDQQFREAMDAALMEVIDDLVRMAEDYCLSTNEVKSLSGTAREEVCLAVRCAARATYDTEATRWALLYETKPFLAPQRATNVPTNDKFLEPIRSTLNKPTQKWFRRRSIRINQTRQATEGLYREPDGRALGQLPRPEDLAWEEVHQRLTT